MRKTIADFNYDYEAYTKYLNSAECSNDDGIDIYADATTGDIYTRTNDDWTKGHGHRNVFNNYNRSENSAASVGRDWKNPW